MRHGAQSSVHTWPWLAVEEEAISGALVLFRQAEELEARGCRELLAETTGVAGLGPKVWA